jgi:hypothetical protein
VPYRIRRPADHHAVAALQPPDAAARADIHILDAFGSQFLPAANIVDVVRVAAVDHDISGLQARAHILE